MQPNYPTTSELLQYLSINICPVIVPIGMVIVAISTIAHFVAATTDDLVLKRLLRGEEDMGLSQLVVYNILIAPFLVALAVSVLAGAVYSRIKSREKRKNDWLLIEKPKRGRRVDSEGEFYYPNEIPPQEQNDDPVI